jgi:protein gp37
VLFFFKQWGGVQKKKFGRELDGRTWDEFPKSVDSKYKVSALAIK